MKIETVDFFYLSMPEVTDEVDGSQDALLVRVQAGGLTGWGECEASPLPSIAAFVCPKSHGVCRPVQESILGQRLDDIDDITRISALAQYNSMDLLQAPHTLSGVEMALWDLLGKKVNAPAWSLLGHKKSFDKTPYASLLFGDDLHETFRRAEEARRQGYKAAKFGWGPIGKSTAAYDGAHFIAAREGLGVDGDLMIDVGQIFGEDVEAAAERLRYMDEAKILWFEEPFEANALSAYSDLASRPANVRIAGGEAAHNYHMAEHLMTYGKLGYIQIDCGRIGGLAPAQRVANRAKELGITYVNHTFTSHLALSASLQPFAGFKEDYICEYPAAPKQLALDITGNHIIPDENGFIRAPEAPGLGMDVITDQLKPYLVEAEIRIGKQIIYQTPVL